MMTNSLLLGSALALGTMAQTTSVMDLFLYAAEGTNIQGSVISAAPDATTYFLNCAAGSNTDYCGLRSGMTFVNGPTTFGQHITEADAITQDIDCLLTETYADCSYTMQGPEVMSPGQGIGHIVGLTDSLTPVTITAGLEKILAVGTATGAASTATSEGAQTAASASSGPSETGDSASATSSSSASSPSTTASGAVTMAGQNSALAALCGLVALALRL